MGNLRFMIGAFSGACHARRRRACVRTWGMDVQRSVGVDLVFLRGDPTVREPCREGDLLTLPCPDDYDSLPQKTRLFCAWTTENVRFEYLFKCDDDTYLRVDRLLGARFTAPYIGHDLGGYASGGAGYLLNRTAARIVATKMTLPVGYEDMEVARTLVRHGIHLTPDGRFYPWPKGGEAPHPSNNLITGHGWRPDDLYSIHEAFEG